jgi:hypothetical protein
MTIRKSIFTFHINKDLYNDQVKAGCDAYYINYEVKDINDGTNRLLITGVTDSFYPLDYMELIQK